MSDSPRLAIFKSAPGVPPGAPESTLVVHEIYASLQGESTWTGLPCVFVRLADLEHTVLLETSGSLDVARVDPRVIKIVDLKCPDSGEAGRNRWENLDVLGVRDEIKFVLASRGDYEWARTVIVEKGLARRWTVLLSVAHGLLAPAEVACWMLEDRLPARFQLQTHKVIWDPSARGV